MKGYNTSTKKVEIRVTKLDGSFDYSTLKNYLIKRVVKNCS